MVISCEESAKLWADSYDLVCKVSSFKYYIKIDHLRRWPDFLHYHLQNRLKSVEIELMKCLSSPNDVLVNYMN